MKGKKGVEVKYVDALETFCNSVLRKHGSVVVSMWLIRSRESRDLYVMLLINNLKVGKSRIKRLERDVLEAEKAIRENLGVHLHSGFYNLSDYFSSVMRGDGEIFREIRHSIPIYDPTGFFGPLKKLVEKGKIVGTKENLLKLVFDVKERYRDIRGIKLRITDNVYAAVVDSGQAALLAAGEGFPIHRDIAPGLRKRFVRRHMLEERYVKYCTDIVDFMKSVEHKKIKSITGKQLDEMIKKGNLFVNRMKDLVEEIERKRC